MTAKVVAGSDRIVAAGLLMVTFMLGMALRLSQLDADSLWTDEIITARMSQRDLPSLATYYERHAHPPLGDIVTRLFVVLSGNSDFVLRWQAMLFGSLSIMLAYRAGEILWTRKEAVMGALLLAMSAYHVRYSQEANPYALMVFLALLSLIFLMKALQTNKKSFWLGFILSTTLSLYNHYFAFLFLPAEVVFAAWVIAENWLSVRREEGHIGLFHSARGLSVPAGQALTFFLSLALVGLFYVPWLPALQAHAAQYTEPIQIVNPAEYESPNLVPRFLLVTLTEYSGAIVLLWVGMFALGLASSGRKRLALMASWMGAPIVFLAVAKTDRFLNPKYVIFILPLYLLVIARGTTTISGGLKRLLRRVAGEQSWLPALTCTLGVLILGGLNVAPLRSHYLLRKEDWRDAARYLTDNTKPGDILLLDSNNYRFRDADWVDFCLSYYLYSEGIPDPPAFQVDRLLGQDLQNVGQEQGQVWAVLGYDRRPPSWKGLEEIRVVAFRHVWIIRLREPSGNLARDTISLLEALLDLLPPEAQFDVHLALAEIHLRTEAFEQARFELEMASQVQPDRTDAPLALAETFSELERRSQPGDVEMQHSLWHRLGDVIAFLGYTVHPLRMQAGDTLHMTLYWQALAKMDRDYSVFTHVVGPDDRRWAQEDRLLRQVQHGGYTTSSWQVEETVREEFELELALDTPPGEYIIKVGIYYWETGERLPARDENEQRAVDDAMSLVTITIED
jgi:hypothetical protein